MNLLGLRLDDRRIVLLPLTILLTVFLGFFAFGPERSLGLVTRGGYWAMLLIFAVWVWSLWRVLRRDWPGLAALRSVPKYPVAVVLGGTALLLVHETFSFKILMDEFMLLGTSMSLHFDKTAIVPMRGHDLEGAFQLLAGELDKRPLFFPFLLSLVHDLAGYRPENAFALNAVLTLALLALAYHVGAKIAGRPGGVITVLLLATLPLLAQNATGGGFEVLNLAMILLTVALAQRFAEKPDEVSIDALVMSAVLLALTRYESVLFLPPVAALVAVVWFRENRVILGTASAFSPLFLTPYLLQNKVFSVRKSAWELAGQPGYEEPFSLAYIPENIPHALNFFFNTTGEHSNSLVLSVLGFIAVPFFALWALKILRTPRAGKPADVAWAIMSLGFAAHAGLMMAYFWGKFDDPVIRRLSLPENLALALLVAAVVAQFTRSIAVWRGVGIAVAAGAMAFSLPAMARHDYSFDYYVGREAEWRRDFIKENPVRDYLVIDNNSIIWITHRVSSTPVRQALEKKSNIIFNLRNATFSKIYAFQRLMVDPATGMQTVQPEDDLGPDYQLETVAERRFTPLTVTRISRVVSVRDGPTTEPDRVTMPLENMTPEEREKVRDAYFQNFVKRLP